MSKMSEMTTDNEEWRPVVGYEGLYEVSNLGRVRSLDRLVMCTNRRGRVFTRAKPGVNLRPGTRPDGHLSVSLGEGNSRLVHHLVLLSFVGPPPPKHECRHLDGNPANNVLSNLQWSTRSANALDRKWHTPPRSHKLLPPQVAAIKRKLAAGSSHSSVAADFGVSRKLIYMIEKGEVHRDVDLHL